MRSLRTFVVAATLGLCTVAVADHPTRNDRGSAALEEVMQRGARSMQAMSTTGDVDHDFVMAMKKHHEDAVAMAKVDLQYGKDPKARQFAQKIIDSQQREIDEFDRWMSEHMGKGTSTEVPK